MCADLGGAHEPTETQHRGPDSEDRAHPHCLLNICFSFAKFKHCGHSSTVAAAHLQASAGAGTAGHGRQQQACAAVRHVWK